MRAFVLLFLALIWCAAVVANEQPTAPSLRGTPVSVCLLAGSWHGDAHVSMYIYKRCDFHLNVPVNSVKVRFEHGELVVGGGALLVNACPLYAMRQCALSLSPKWSPALVYLFLLRRSITTGASKIPKPKVTERFTAAKAVCRAVAVAVRRDSAAATPDAAKRVRSASVGVRTVDRAPQAWGSRSIAVRRNDERRV